ncbi:UNVERIFIED_CONTAM: hypothetical protein Scaly_3028700 [Sesamum calycinum]|uniref:CCHC-type domain-containing protein n=1 Tax=Sesamum calycinum TaxID=2727403 RepID=A0AAW2K6S3_9LAMI
MAPVNITASINTIPMLNSLYFKSWKQNLEIVLGMMDLDLTLREDSPPALTDKSTSEEKREKERWDKSNRFVKNEQAEIGTLLTSLTLGKFSQFKVSYNCQKEAWSLNKLISHCVQEEERLKQDKTKCAYFALTSKAKDKGKKRKKIMELQIQPHRRIKQQESNDSKVVCYFCKAEGHIKKHCTNFHAWLTKKDLPELPKAQ